MVARFEASKIYHSGRTRYTEGHKEGCACQTGTEVAIFIETVILMGEYKPVGVGEGVSGLLKANTVSGLVNQVFRFVLLEEG